MALTCWRLFQISEPDRAWACEDITAADHPLRRHIVVVLNTNMYFANILLPNPHLRADLVPFLGKQWSHLTANPFSPIFRWFIVPKSGLATKIRHVRDKLLRSDWSVGLQMRVSESYGKLEQLSAWWACLEHVLAQGNSDVRIFLATDNHVVQTAAVQRFGHKLLIGRQLQKVVSNFNVRKSNMMVEDALLDIFMLANCDVRMQLVTPHAH